MEAKPLVVIVGPTASGKTSLAIKMARLFNGEIICADSRTVYKGMDIGTAKPTVEEQALVRHWALDLVEPGEYFSAADFKEYAIEKIADIRSRGKVPFLVGGTGLYVDAVVFDYEFGPKSDPLQRQKLEAMTLEELENYCFDNNIELPENSGNKRYIVRAIEQKSINNKRRESPIKNCNIVGISTEKEILRQRIHDRAQEIFHSNVVEEATMLGDRHGWDSEAMTGNIYPLCKQYVDGDITIEQAREKFETLDWRLAKRQLTWLRRNKYINWFDLADAEKYIVRLLSSEH